MVWWLGFVVLCILGVLVELFVVTLGCWVLDVSCVVARLLFIYAFVVALRLCRVVVGLGADVLLGVWLRCVWFSDGGFCLCWLFAFPV